MSDVWQGPGWWLASDGKWYPADAEPGAVYEGDLSNTDVSVDDADAVSDDETNGIGAPDAAATTPEPPADESSHVGIFGQPVSDPFDDRAAGAAEPASGGWQVIDEPSEDLAPVAEDLVSDDSTPGADRVEEDGWTSAYEERQATSDVLDEMAPVTTAPAAIPKDLPLIDLPLIDLPDMAAPIIEDAAEVDVPDLDAEIPDISAPAFEAPQVDVPDPDIPNAEMPTMAIPEVIKPDLTIPEVETPDLVMEDLTVPDMSVPDVSVPDLTIPDMSIPDVSVPDLTIPDVSIPDVSVPDLTIPDVSVSDFEAPEIEPTDFGVADDFPDVDPTSSIPDVSVPSSLPIGDTSIVADLDDRMPRTQSSPIEREDAWRKPLSPEATQRLEANAPLGAPGVVDLAIPDEPEADSVDPASQNWRLIGTVVAGLALLVLIAWLISKLFAGGTDETSTSNTTTPVTDTSEVSVTSDSETTSTPTSVQSTTSSDGAQSVFSLRAGDCIVGDIGAGQVTKVEKVDCEIEHTFEVYREALIDSSITTFDEAAISAYAEEVCRTSLAAYIPADDDRGLKFKFLQPTEDSWNQEEDPDRVITCLLFDDNEPLIGRAA